MFKMESRLQRQIQSLDTDADFFTIKPFLWLVLHVVAQSGTIHFYRGRGSVPGEEKNLIFHTVRGIGKRSKLPIYSKSKRLCKTLQ